MSMTPPSDGGHSVMPADLDKLRTDVERKFHAALMEQEHRFLPAITNFSQYYFGTPGDDPRKRAVLRAVLWRFFGPATVAATGIGIVSLLSLLIAILANILLGIQNEKIEVQNQLIEGQRRAALMFEMTSILEAISDRRLSPGGGLDAGGGNPRIVLPEVLVGRIRALSRSLRPYRYLDVSSDSRAPGRATRWHRAAAWIGVSLDTDATKLTDRPLSPERGQLLLTLVDSRIDMETINGSFFRRPIAPGKVVILDPKELTAVRPADFSYADLRGADLRHAHLEGSLLRSADFREINGNGIVLERADLAGADFTWAILAKANLRGAFISGTNFTNANLEGADLESAHLARVMELPEELRKEWTFAGEGYSPVVDIPYRRDIYYLTRVEPKPPASALTSSN